MSKERGGISQITVILIVIIFGGFWVISFFGMLIQGLLILIPIAGLTFAYYYFSELSANSKRRSFQPDKLKKFEKEFKHGPYTFKWVQNAECQFKPNISLICDTQGTDLPFYLPPHEGNQIIYGIIFLKSWGPYSTELIAKVANDEKQNLYSSGGYNFKSNDLIYGMEKQFSNVSRAIQFVNSNLQIESFYFRKTPTSEELVDNLSFLSYSKKVNNSIEWRGHLTIDSLELIQITSKDFDQILQCYGVIYKKNGQLFLNVPKTVVQILVKDENFEESAILELPGTVMPISIDEIAWAMGHAEANIDKRIMWNICIKDYYR